jgi:stage III sporulation protein AG
MEKKWVKSETWESLKKRVEEIGLSKIVIIFLAGIFLLVISLPTGKSSGVDLSQKTDSSQTDSETLETDSAQDTAWKAMSEYASRQEKELEEVLSKVEGMGKVDVMVTIAASEERKTLAKESVSGEESLEEESSGGKKTQSSSSEDTDPVLVEEGENQTPYVVQISSPEIEGVLVVAEGAGSASVDSEIIAAVEALFPVEAHKIKVMKASSLKD